MLILGISRFVKLFTLGPEEAPLVFAVAVGVIPYPVTFLCTDFISEFARTRRMLWFGWVWHSIFLWSMVGSVGRCPGLKPLMVMAPRQRWRRATSFF